MRWILRHFEEVLGSALFAVMVTVSFVNVVVRYCTNFSFAWSEELTVNLFVWVVLLGTAIAFRERANLALSLVYEKSPKAARLAFYLISIALCIAFFGALLWTGAVEVLDEIELESTSESLEIPVWCYTCATPLFSGLIIFRILQQAVSALRTGKF